MLGGPGVRKWEGERVWLALVEMMRREGGGGCPVETRQGKAGQTRQTILDAAERTNERTNAGTRWTALLLPAVQYSGFCRTLSWMRACERAQRCDGSESREQGE